VGVVRVHDAAARRLVLKAGFTPGLSVRFLLVSALTLMHGWHLAVVASALVLAVLTLAGGAEWSSFGTNLLCTAIVPALVTAWLHEFVHDRLPHHSSSIFS
jgi:uncharacterized membrane protein